MVLSPASNEAWRRAIRYPRGPVRRYYFFAWLAPWRFLYHGSAILFGSFGGQGPQLFAASHHWPAVMGYLIGLAQFAGGLAVLSGILFRFGAACIAVVMLGAIFLVHLPNGFYIGKGGAEYALTQLLLAVAFLLTGPGSYSLAFLLPAPLRKF